MTEKLTMHTRDLVQENVERIGELFPSCVTETIDSKGNIVHSIDFEALKRQLSDEIVVEDRERYVFTWPGKSASQQKANEPAKDCIDGKEEYLTLRPNKAKSVNFDSTKNVYIEGDNLNALKMLRETYLGKVKMIYIDPPYNTGNDFVYNDKFVTNREEYDSISGDYDESGNKLVLNTDGNGRFHTDWLNMLYPRLLLAKDLLREDGVIFISIDDNEVANMLKLCDDVFGHQNFESLVTWRRRTNQPNDKSKMIAKVAEHIVVYARNSNYLAETKAFHGVPLNEERRNEYKNPDNDPRGPWSSNPWKAAVGRGGSKYSITTPKGITYTETWYGNEETFKQLLFEGKIHWTDGGSGVPRVKIYLRDAEKDGQAAINFFTPDKYGSNQEGSSELESLFQTKGLFDNPKPTKLIKSLLQLATDEDSLVLDFFSGSGTTADAIYQLNRETGSNRRFILIQLPESTPKDSIAFKNGFAKITDLGEERIRLAGKKQALTENNTLERGNGDYGFRVFTVSSSNMNSVYYNPKDYTKDILSYSADNIKLDRTPEDLFIQVMLELGVELSSTIETKEICGKQVLIADNCYLIACFDEKITDEVVTEIAKKKPAHVVFRDSSMANDSVAINFEQIFKAYSPNTRIRVL